MAKRSNGRDMSSREDFVVEQFTDFRNLNKLACKCFDVYYVDSEPSADLSPMMRTVVPSLWVDPNNPEYPGMYVLAGHSLVPFLERMIFVTPYVSDKGKYVNDLSAFKGLLINASEFFHKTKNYRKTALEPMVVVADGVLGEHTPQSIIMRESRTKRKDELICPVLQLPIKTEDNLREYTEILNKSVYSPFYNFLPRYLSRDKRMRFQKIQPNHIEEIKENGRCDIVFTKDRVLTISKDIFPGLDSKNQYFAYFVEDPDVPPESGKSHVILKEVVDNERGNPTIVTLTLMAAMAQKHHAIPRSTKPE